MTPNIDKITIQDNISLIEHFIDDMLLKPRKSLQFWSQITKQTPAAKIGYIGQHLASLITGVPGTGSGARGDDLSDKTEVKSCNKIDQVDTCTNCGRRVFRYQERCPFCNSAKIDRKEDSKWLFSVRDENELTQYLNLERILLILFEYPDFKYNKFDRIKITSYEIYPKEERMHVFNDLLKNHYYNIYLPKIKKQMKSNPMNLHPDSYQFYKCNPIKTFQCTIDNIDADPGIDDIHIDKNAYIEPTVERNSLIKSVDMPSQLLQPKEWNILIDYICKNQKENILHPFSADTFSKLPKKDKSKYLPFINEELKEIIPLRKIISTTQHAHYHRQ